MYIHVQGWIYRVGGERTFLPPTFWKASVDFPDFPQSAHNYNNIIYMHMYMYIHVATTSYHSHQQLWRGQYNYNEQEMEHEFNTWFITVVGAILHVCVCDSSVPWRSAQNFQNCVYISGTCIYIIIPGPSLTALDFLSSRGISSLVGCERRSSATPRCTLWPLWPEDRDLDSVNSWLQVWQNPRCSLERHWMDSSVSLRAEWSVLGLASRYAFIHLAERESEACSAIAAEQTSITHLFLLSWEIGSSTQWKKGHPFLSLCKAQA